MQEIQKKRISKFLSLVLRHRPDSIGVTLDDAGWVAVDSLLAGMRNASRTITMEQLEIVVRDNDKQRFQWNEDQSRIRATQGHSIQVELGYEESTPPEILYHGTPKQFVDAVMREGLKKQKRHHVHLHGDADLATRVGERRGEPVLLTIEAAKMAQAGFSFYVTPNSVWLTEAVPVEFLRSATEHDSSAR